MASVGGVLCLLAVFIYVECQKEYLMSSPYPDNIIDHFVENCTSNTTRFDEIGQHSCYIVPQKGSFLRSWDEAQTVCAIYEAGLVMLESDKEIDYVTELLEKEKENQIKNNRTYPKCFWLGAQRAVTEVFMWVTDGDSREVRFGHWAPGEPKILTSANRLMMCTSGSYRWIATDGFSKEGFVCEYYY